MPNNRGVTILVILPYNYNRYIRLYLCPHCWAGLAIPVSTLLAGKALQVVDICSGSHHHLEGRNNLSMIIDHFSQFTFRHYEARPHRFIVELY
jgi:hypothetical protein